MEAGVSVTSSSQFWNYVCLTSKRHRNQCHSFHVDSPFIIDKMSMDFRRGNSMSNWWRIHKDVSIELLETVRQLMLMFATNLKKTCWFHRLKNRIVKTNREKKLFDDFNNCRFLLERDRAFTLHKNWSFLLKISSVNVTKFAVSCRFGHIYWRNPWKTSIFVQC